MGDVVRFQAATEFAARKNLARLVEHCRSKLTAFGEHLDFDGNTWTLDGVRHKGKNFEIRATFSSWRDGEPLAEPFLSFAKSYVRYTFALRPLLYIAHKLAALRALEAAIAERYPEPACISRAEAFDFDRAAQLIRERYKESTAYGYAHELQAVSAFIVKHGLTARGFEWNNPVRRPRCNDRIGREFEERRRAKLPSPRALEALGHIFHMATEPSDVIVSSLVAVLCAAPDRVNEVLGLSVGCGVRQRVPSTGHDAYGLRWQTSKGGAPMVKWVVDSMAGVVEEAVDNLERLSRQPRAIARWYEQNSGAMFLPPELEHLRGAAALSMEQLGDLLFIERPRRTIPLQWCRTHGVPVRVKGKRPAEVSFSDVENAVLRLLPGDFPRIATSTRLYSEALCLIHKNELHANRATYRCMFDLVEHGDIHNRLGARSAAGIPSVFDKFGFAEPGGERMVVTTHQFRHYLNTLAQQGGLSQLDIAKWSGRVHVGQNDAYNHLSDRDVLATVRATVGATAQMFGAVTALKRAPMLARAHFSSLNLTAAHTTDFGYCVHDFTMMPCQLHRDCINCHEQICLKGDDAAEANIRVLQRETRELLAAAHDSLAEGDAGADRWVEHQRATLSRLDQMCLALDDPSVPPGSIMRFAEGKKSLTFVVTAGNDHRGVACVGCTVVP